MEQQSFLPFPHGFLWGAASSSHQVEGNTHNNWSVWEQSDRRLSYLKRADLITQYGKDNFISGRGCDHYHYFANDFARAKELGHNATRISLEWSRIEPQEGVFDQAAIQHYRDVIAQLKRLDIEPFVTIWHWTLPLWLSSKGGVAHNDAPQYFARYAHKMATALPDVHFWLTVNEPVIYADNSYLNGNWPPQQRNLFAYFTVLHNLLHAHRAMYQAIKAANGNAAVSAAENIVYYEAYKNKFINRIAKNVGDYFWNSYFFDRIKDHYDFIGLNHYFHNRIQLWSSRNENEKVSDMGWELYPEAIYHVLHTMKKYQKPVYITENGLADAKDRYRKWFITETLKNVHRAISEGVDVRGYLHWSLMDNFEWDKGFWPRFGLLAVNYETLERTPRKSALAFAKICKQNGLSL